MSRLKLVITSRDRDLGGFNVRRVLPYPTHRMVGPFLFLDHMGPTQFAPGKGMDVRPHPHINLATVTYLFEGAIHHRDSLGSDQRIEPGAINWMTAGRGIVHSERMPEVTRVHGGRLNGLQCWVALPENQEECEPSFEHHPAVTLPQFLNGSIKLKLLLGKSAGHESPVKVHSDLFYMEALMPKGAVLEFDSENRETAAYLVHGEVRVEEQRILAGSMAVGDRTQGLKIEALQDSRVMLLGGKSVGPRFMFWNFVSSSKDRLEEVKREWAKGPGHSPRFPKIPGDDQEFIPLPDEAAPKGTPL
ncbi:MAG: pirin family protein [Bdellovibrionales bacterium]|nr:pirin family protein [Bdellovibrionales bacterium]